MNKISGKLLKYATAKEYNINNTYAYKEIEGYYVTLCEGYGYYRCMISVSEKRAGEYAINNIEEYIQRKSVELSLSKFRWDVEGMELWFKNNNPSLIDNMDILLNTIISKLKASDVPGVDICPFCGKKNYPEISSDYYLNFYAVKAHDACMKHQDKQQKLTQSKKYIGGKHASGIFGAIWGSGVGSLAFIVSLIIGKNYAFLAIIIAFFVKFYYEAYDGKKDLIGEFLIVASVTMLAAWGTCILGTYIYGYTKDAAEWIKYKDSYKNALIFAAIGVLPLRYRIDKNRAKRRLFRIGKK